MKVTILWIEEIVLISLTIDFLEDIIYDNIQGRETIIYSFYSNTLKQNIVSNVWVYKDAEFFIRILLYFIKRVLS